MTYFVIHLTDILCLFMYQFCHESNFLEIIQQVRQFGSILNEGTGSDYSHKNLIYNIFSYLFFPFEFINRDLGFLSFAILEGLVLFYIIFIVAKYDLKKININYDTSIFLVFLSFFYIIIYLSIFPNVFGNFGLVLRQKLMIVPFLFFFILSLKNFLSIQDKKSKLSVK